MYIQYLKTFFRNFQSKMWYTKRDNEQKRVKGKGKV